MSVLLGIELAAVICGVVYIFLLMYENIWCWPIGILGSLLSIYLFFDAGLFSEALLYSYYVFIGFYGWMQWSSTQNEKLAIIHEDINWHLKVIGLGILLSFLLGYLMSFLPTAQRPFVDATTTIFSFIASYMQAKKMLSSWIFWILINVFSVWLYFDRGLEFYGLLMIFYFQLSAQGYFLWSKLYSERKVQLK